MTKSGYTVAVLGAAGGIGQSLSLLLKLNTTGLISTLNLYDLATCTPGVAADLSHIPTCTKVFGYTGPENLPTALKGADIVLVPAGVPRKPGMSRDDLYNINAGINADLAKACAKSCPDAAFLIISNPVNSMVPIWAQTLTKAGVYNPKKLFGVTTLDISRANTFASERANTPTHVPVIGGHSGSTIVPLFSLAKPALQLEGEDLEKMIHRVAYGGEEVISAKAGAGSATLSMAAAGCSFTDSILRALNGEKVKEIAFVENKEAQERFGTRFFATEIILGKDGICEVVNLYDKASEVEKKKVAEMIETLKEQIEKGEKFIPQE